MFFQGVPSPPYFLFLKIKSLLVLKYVFLFINLIIEDSMLLNVAASGVGFIFGKAYVLPT